MMALPRRSLARFAAPALLSLAACTPQLDLSDRPGPCAPGLAVCPTSGRCVDPSEIGKMPVEGVTPVCDVGFTARQGTTVLVPVPGARPADVTIDKAPSEFVVTVPPVAADAPTFVKV